MALKIFSTANAIPTLDDSDPAERIVSTPTEADLQERLKELPRIGSDRPALKE